MHLGARLAPVHGARTCEVAPFCGPHVGGVQDRSGKVEEAGVVEAVQDLLVQPAPDSGPRSEQEPAVGRRLRYPEARRQRPPGAHPLTST